MKKLLISMYVFLLICINLTAQFPPPAGQEGSTAIHADSSVFIDWASACTVDRGYLNIMEPESGFVSFGEEADATGNPDNIVLSLGDAGSAVLTFGIPLADGPGFDFAVFENSFSDDYLELAFVEVSSNGLDFQRFDAVSLTQTEVQVDAFGTLETGKINNLAGKYQMFYGTPFDLAELAGTPGLDIMHITHVRVTDVIGCIQDQFAFYDSQGNKINDPWPTPFPSGGFDLDAVGVIHNTSNAGIGVGFAGGFMIYPNPAYKNITVEVPKSLGVNHFDIFDIQGKLLTREQITGSINMRAIYVIDLEGYDSGLYFICLEAGSGRIVQKIIIR